LLSAAFTRRSVLLCDGSPFVLLRCEASRKGLLREARCRSGGLESVVWFSSRDFAMRRAARRQETRFGTGSGGVPDGRGRLQRGDDKVIALRWTITIGSGNGLVVDSVVQFVYGLESCWLRASDKGWPLLYMYICFVLLQACREQQQANGSS
jgi:hypothetical protein